jgi:hypothetical protein
MTTNVASLSIKFVRNHAHPYVSRLARLYDPAHLYVNHLAHLLVHRFVKSHVLQEEDAIILQPMNCAAAMESLYQQEIQVCACLAINIL